MASFRALSRVPAALGRPAPAFGAARAPAAVVGAARRQFHATPRAAVSVGDRIPDLEVLVEDTPGNKVSLAKELAKTTKGLVIGVPAAFSPACSTSHVPGYISHPQLKNAGRVFVVSVNDPFV